MTATNPSPSAEFAPENAQAFQRAHSQLAPGAQLAYGEQ